MWFSCYFMIYTVWAVLQRTAKKRKWNILWWYLSNATDYGGVGAEGCRALPGRSVQRRCWCSLQPSSDRAAVLQSGLCMLCGTPVPGFSCPPSPADNFKSQEHDCGELEAPQPFHLCFGVVCWPRWVEHCASELSMKRVSVKAMIPQQCFLHVLDQFTYPGAWKNCKVEKPQDFRLLWIGPVLLLSLALVNFCTPPPTTSSQWGIFGLLFIVSCWMQL